MSGKDSGKTNEQILWERISDLEKSLAYERMRSRAFEKLIEIAEREEGISILKKNTRCLMIDDLGEGLDYQRSNMLGNIVIDFCKEHEIQLLATTNDSFLMDTIDLKYWTVLSRKGGVVTSISESTHPALFHQFKMMGLNNFDLFASDFIYNHSGREE